MAVPSHILVAVDFTLLSEHALERALDLAERLGAHVTVLHVYTLPALRIADSDYIPSAEEAARVSEANEKQLEALCARHVRAGVTVKQLLRTGAPAAEIVAASAELGADMIAVGTHGRGAIGRAILGSVAHDVLRTAHVPVLTVHEPKK